jgi:hypothetical protein
MEQKGRRLSDRERAAAHRRGWLKSATGTSWGSQGKHPAR